MHNFNAGQKDPGTAKSFESQHGSRASLDRAMVMAGIEVMHMIRKGQMRDDGIARNPAEKFYSIMI